VRRECDRAEERIRVILEGPALELHPDRTRGVGLFDGKEGFDFLGCHLPERLSGTPREPTGRRPNLLQCWPLAFHERGLHRLRGTVRYPEQPFWQHGAA
jgi:RNA-directed DNA polymerase